MATKAEIIQESNSTYVPNTSGLITPQTVQTLNTDWINASIFPEQTGSMSVRSAATASFLLGSIASASFANFATSASQATNALTASFLLGSVTSASLAQNSLLLQGTGSDGFVTTGSFNTTSGSLSTRVTSLESFSSSLNSTFATDAELNAATQSLSASISTVNSNLTVVSSSLLVTSASLLQVSASYIALSASYNISSGSESARITNLESFSSSLDATFATDAQLNAATQSLSASTSTVNTRVTEVSGSLLQVSSSTQQVSASYIALSGSYNTFSGSESARTTRLESTASTLVAASASFSTRVSDNTSNIQTLTSATASYAVLANNQTFSGKNTFNNDVTASNVRITGTASIAFLDVTFQSSSVIYSSGSNQFGDASNDTQTLFGTVNVVTGPLVVTGSANFKETITGSISGNAAFATNAEFATTASLASFAVIATAALTASYATTASSAEKSFEAVSSSYAFTASSAVNAANAISASFATTASFVTGTITSASFATSASRAISSETATSASFATSASRALSADSSTTSLSGSSILIDNYNGINSTYYLTMVDNATGYKRVGLDTDLSYNPSTNILNGTIQSAATASSITIDNYNGSNTTYYLTMVTDASGAKRVGLDTDLSYNPSTNLLTGLITSAQNATSASRAVSAESATSSSFANTTISASYAYTASSAISSSFASIAGNVVGTVTSASYAFTASSAVNATNALTASSLTALNQTVTITGSVNVSGSIRISQGDDLITHHVQAAAVNGVEIQNNSGNVVGLFGAGGSLGSTFYGQVNATAFSGSGAQIFGVVSSSFASTASIARTATSASLAQFALTAFISLSSSYADNANTANSATSATSASYAYTASSAISSSFALTASYLDGAVSAFPFTGSAVITGSLNVIGDTNIRTGSLWLINDNTGSGYFSIKPFVTESYLLGSKNNIWFDTQFEDATSGSGMAPIEIKGNSNIFSQYITSVFDSNNSLKTGFSGANNYVTTLPYIASGSATGSGQIISNNSFLLNNINFSPKTGSANLTLSATNQNRSATITASGSVTFNNVNNQSLLTVNNLSNGSLNLTSLYLGGTNAFTTVSSSFGSTISNSLLIGVTAYVSASSTNTLTAIAAVGSGLIISSSGASATTSGMGMFGINNANDGITNRDTQTRFAVGTGTSTANANRRTSLHVSASGMTTINDGLNVRGIHTGTTELEVRATGVKIGNLLADAHNLTGSFSITGSQTITGSLIGQPVSQSVSSNTASLNLATGNFFNLTLPESTNTYITASGQIPGQTINLKITQGATTGSVSFGAGIKQPSGSAYVATAVASAVDIVTFISFDNTGLYVSNVNNLI